MKKVFVLMTLFIFVSCDLLGVFESLVDYDFCMQMNNVTTGSEVADTSSANVSIDVSIANTYSVTVNGKTEVFVFYSDGTPILEVEEGQEVAVSLWIKGKTESYMNKSELYLSYLDKEIRVDKLPFEHRIIIPSLPSGDYPVKSYGNSVKERTLYLRVKASSEK